MDKLHTEKESEKVKLRNDFLSEKNEMVHFELNTLYKNVMKICV